MVSKIYSSTLILTCLWTSKRVLTKPLKCMWVMPSTKYEPLKKNRVDGQDGFCLFFSTCTARIGHALLCTQHTSIYGQICAMQRRHDELCRGGGLCHTWDRPSMCAACLAHKAMPHLTYPSIRQADIHTRYWGQH